MDNRIRSLPSETGWTLSTLSADRNKVPLNVVFSYEWTVLDKTRDGVVVSTNIQILLK